jgi:phytoene dehydrogenase-like protein
MPEYDAIVVGAGPNGLATAIQLARAGWSVIVYEALPTIGGGVRSAELTLPGFTHDVCSAIHPLGMASPFFRSLPLDQYGVEWIQPDVPLAHPFEDGTAALLERSFEATGATLGADAATYRRLMKPFVDHWEVLIGDILGPLRFPRNPLVMGAFGIVALPSARMIVKTLFKDRYAAALFGGMAAHSFLPLNKLVSSSFGMVLGILGHAVGWPMPRGGSQKIVDAMAAYLTSLGGKIVTNTRIESLDDLPSARAVVFDTTPRQMLPIVGNRFPDRYRRALENYRYGPGIFKVDWALNEPIPWKAPGCARAGTVHLGGTFEEIELSERAAWEGRIPEKPMVLVAQQSRFDSTRAPEGKHTGWAYCHVPSGSTVDMTAAIENQIERYAPGFKDLILGRSTYNSVQFQQYNPNYIGGDINGGVQDLGQLFTRPNWSLVPYRTAAKGIYICSASTPPGGGVHGMGGYFAAKTILRDLA